MRRSLQTLLVVIGLLMPLAAANAQNAKEAPVDTWGENTQPENYVRSKGPAEEGHTYNWVQMGYAGIVMVGMLGFMYWLVRRTPKKSRQASSDPTGKQSS